MLLPYVVEHSYVADPKAVLRLRELSEPLDAATTKPLKPLGFVPKMRFDPFTDLDADIGLQFVEIR